MIDLPAAFQVGSTVYSRTRHHADDDSLPIGGVVIDIYDRTDQETGETGRYAKTVTIYRGRVLYANIDVDDIEPGASVGLVRSDVLKQLALRLAADEAECRDPFRHDDARRAIQRALINAGHR
jgi:hypothetical protein